ncbi:MAG: 50S ribosomal protein L35 [Anaerolineae bacterium]|nr:50S ribosomal protein L35 [Anaerolineae bacterium]
MAKKYKLKTHKATAKRIKMTGGGKLMRTKVGKSHFRRRRSARLKAQLSKSQVVIGAGQIKRIRRLAPYLKRYKANPPA